MTESYKYLHISLRYTHGARSTNVFTFPAGERPVRPSFDTPAIVSHFVNLNEFYVMGCHDSRRFYSFVSIDENVGAGTRLELTLSTDCDVLLMGREVINFFNSVKDMLDNEESFTDATISASLTACGFSEQPLRGAAVCETAGSAGTPCWRQYQSTNDLATIFSFPRQAAYAPYSEVVVAGPMAMPVGDDPLPSIGTPVAQAFTVVCPEGVIPSAESVELTDKLSLTYTRPYFEPTTETFEVGTTNRFVKIAGPALIVNDADKAGVVFMERVSYTVVSSKGAPVSTYTILINGRTATRTDGVFEVSNNDFNRDGVVTITVSSTNYFTTTLNLTAGELHDKQPLELVLVPEEMQVILRLDFGNGRMMQQELLLEKNSSEYRQLRAGSFHGFRAHRLMGHDPETYNVGMTAPTIAPAMRTVADTYANRPAAEPKVVEKPTETTEEKAPVKEAVETSARTAETERPKSAAELRAERLRADIPTKPEVTSEATDSKKNRKKAYAADIPRKVDILQDDPDDDEEEAPRRNPLLSPMVLAATSVILITVGIVWYLFTLLPSENDGLADAVDVTEQTTSAADAERISVIDDVPNTVSAQDATAANAAEPAKTAEATADEKADESYLNANNTWRLSDLKSQKYKDFFNTLSTGDIDAIAGADYFAVADKATNHDAIKIVEFLWEAKGTFAEKRNVKAMQALKGKESINVHDLYESLSRMRDSKPNTAPRPKR